MSRYTYECDKTQHAHWMWSSLPAQVWVGMGVVVLPKRMDQNYRGSETG